MKRYTYIVSVRVYCPEEYFADDLVNEVISAGEKAIPPDVEIWAEDSYLEEVEDDEREKR